MTTIESIEKMSKLLEDFSNISLTHTKSLNNLADICLDLKKRVVWLEHEAMEREADCKENYVKIKMLGGKS